MSDQEESLKCPQCGCIEFDFDAAPGATEPTATTLLECANCGNKLTYEVLEAANADSQATTAQQMGEEFAKDLTETLQAAIKKLGF